MALAPTGPITTPLVALRTMLSRSSTWQTWTGEATEAGAIGHVYYYAIPGTATADTAEEYEAALAAARPYAILATGSYQRDRLAGGPHTWIDTGQALVIIETGIPSAYSGDDDQSDLGVWFESNCGGVVSDVCDLSGDVGLLSVRSVAIDDGPSQHRTDGGERYLQVALAIEWGA